MEFKVFAEHAQQVLLQAHHQRMDPGVKQHIGTLKTHLRCVARGEILHMHGGRYHRAGNRMALGDVALHLRAQNQLGLQLRDLRLYGQVVVADQGLDAIELGGVAHFAGEFAAVGAHANDLKAHLVLRKTGGGNHVRGVAEYIHALTRQVG